jgi:hypothetical protein
MATAINPCSIFSLIAGDNDTSVAVTSDKFFADDNDTSEQLSPGVIDTGEKSILSCKAARHVNKDPVEMASCQGWNKVEGDKLTISPAA